MILRQRKPARLLVIGLCLVGIVSLFKLVQPAEAQNASNVARLAGPWQATLIWTNSGCGSMTGLLNFTLDRNGTSTSAVLTTHSSGCGDNSSNENFVIQSLDANGSGTANLTCGGGGGGCGWELNIQVAKDGQVFNLVDVSPLNPGNFVAGTAISQ